MMPPKPSATKLVRFPKVKRVTICVGFRCVDGILLCADTQETVGNYLKRKQPKIEIRGDEFFSQRRMPSAVFAGAAEDGDLLDVIVDKLWRAMEPQGSSGLDAMVTAAENELTAQYQRLVPLYPSGVPGMALLVGLWAGPHELDLLKISGPLLKRHVMLDAIGCGDILATYLTSRFLYIKSWLAQAVPVGIYVVDQAKEHVEGCGGETQLVTINGESGMIDRPLAEEVEAEAKRLRSIDGIARHIVGLAMGEFSSADQFSGLLDDPLKSLHKFLKIKPSTSEK